MQISLKWINELVNIEDIELDELIDKLTLGGFEVEEILEVEINNKKEIALDISATANRSDSLSIQGISTEIKALLDKSNRSLNYSMKLNDLKQQLLVHTKVCEEQSDCNIFSSIIIENITNINIPKWVTKKLISAGIKPVQNLLDFQNYILLETGYPFSFYDCDKINAKLNNSDFNLTISKAQSNQPFLAINETEYNLDESILIVKANEVPISIAGIIESQEFAYSQTTTSLLIEASIFNAAKIRQQSRKLGVRTDRSTRYEKSLKNTYLIEALYRLILLLRISNPELHCKFHTMTKTMEQIPDPIILRSETVNEILGPSKNSKTGEFEYISIKNIENYLNRLNFTFSYDELKKSWQVIIPHSRTDDVTREIDLIEEIGRLHGFNNFLITLPKLKTVGIEDASYKTRKKITSALLNLGFNELIHYSLVNENTFINNEIKLVNPLVSEYSSLRMSLLPNLIKTVQENLKQSNSIINGFEYGHVFLADSISKFQEKEYVAGIFGGLKTKLTWSDSDTPVTWFEAKGKIEQLFYQLNVSVIYKNASNHSISNLFHTYRNAEVYLSSGLKMGIFGQMNPILANQLNLSSEFYLFEFDLEMIQDQIKLNQLTTYKSYSAYPKIIKDISFIIKQEITFNEIQELLYYNGTKFLSKINLLDEYKGNSIPAKHTSLCLQLIFQSNKKTLQNKEIEEIIKNLRNVLKDKFNATIRD
jgi:phenylalanyl-tRNA synthetase beta chain